MPDAPAADPTTDPATPATDPAPADPAPVTDPPASAEDGEKDPRVTRANSEAARYRTERNALQQQLEKATTEQQAMLAKLGQALGLTPDAGSEADPAAQVGTLTTQVETLTNRTQQLEAELLVHTIAPDAGANPVALLDSRSFADALGKIDPSADDYRDQVAAAIKGAVDTSPSFRAQGQVPSAGGAETAGQGAGGGAVVTAEQFAQMDYQARADLHATNPALYSQLAG